MKKGCFIKGIFILTIVVGVIVYIVQTKFDSLILTPGKKYLSELASKGINKSLRSIKESPEKDTLNVMLNNFFGNKMFTLHTFSDKMFTPLTDSLEKFSRDSIIDKNELNKLKLILKKIEDEGSKEN